MPTWKSYSRRRWEAFVRTPFGCLLRIFVGRMFHGGGETGTGELGLGVGAVLILTAMPGLLVSLLMFEKYGSLIRWLRGDGAFDPFAATIADEYFFIVLSTSVTGAVALWHWDSIFLDRRDHSNLVVLPISLRTIFFASLAAVFALAVLFALVVNAASFLLFPVAVVGSQGSFSILLRFALGHAMAVVCASVFSFFAVFAIAGLLIAILPAAAFHRIALFARFALAVVLLGLLASVFTVPDDLKRMPVASAHKLAMLPPVSMLGLARTVWVKGNDVFATGIARAAVSALGLSLLTSIVAYAFTFHSSFLRIPETTDVGILPRSRMKFSCSRLGLVLKATRRASCQRACYDFTIRTLFRSDAHLQVVSAFAAFGFVAVAQTLMSIRADQFFSIRHFPSADFLSIPFILSYSLTLGIRFAFEVPVNLDANWIFRFWLPPDDHLPRSVARWVLLSLSVLWLAPACFGITLILFGWLDATLHTLVLIACNILLVEILLVHFRKISFTCSYPPFESNAGVILLAYLFGFFVYTDYLPEMERWSLLTPLRTLCFVPIFAIAFGALYAYRKQILDIDKQLIFEESRSSF
jgi:hypothetical protein